MCGRVRGRLRLALPLREVPSWPAGGKKAQSRSHMPREAFNRPSTECKDQRAYIFNLLLAQLSWTLARSYYRTPAATNPGPLFHLEVAIFSAIPRCQGPLRRHVRWPGGPVAPGALRLARSKAPGPARALRGVLHRGPGGHLSAEGGGFEGLLRGSKAPQTTLADGKT